MSRQFLPGTPPIVVEAARVKSARDSRQLGLLFLWTVSGGLVAFGMPVLGVEGLLGPTAWLALGIAAIAVVGISTRWISEMPSVQAERDAVAVLEAWNGQREAWAAVAVANEIAELADADPSLVRAWQEAQETSPEVRLRSRREAA